MHRAGKPALAELNQHLTCKLCKGYFVDATTIVECLHSFCRSCIVRYLAANKYCPVCDVQVHKTKPLLSIRQDKTLQDIVYKLVPRLLQNEAQRRREFYKTHPEGRTSLEQLIDNYQHIITTDESISLTLSYYGCKESTRYLRCPAAVTIGHIQKLIRAKYDLKDNHHVDIMYNQDCLISTLTLTDLAYIYTWKRKGPMELSYRIYEYKVKEVEVKNEKKDVQNNINWKEVQLRISENGEMSIIQDEALEHVNNNNYKKDLVTVVEEKKELPPKEESVNKEVPKVSKKKEESTPKKEEVKGKGTKRKSEVPPETKQPKQTILNHSLVLHNLSNNHPLKKHSQQNEKTEEATFTKPQNVNKNLRPGTPKPCYMPKNVINVPKPSTIVANTKNNDKLPSPLPTPLPPPPTSVAKPIKSKPNTPIGYKTLRDPPKSWNSQIAKANLNKPIEPKYNDLKNVKPAKFFKMRNNMPRYLGNPASGVKPMYQVQVSPEKEKEKEKVKEKSSGSVSVSEIKKHSIVKIDPKTLKPISEKAPETSSLSNSGGSGGGSDLKINASSVSIFNPLKLQNSSPKTGERKSPKSPHSPKTISGKQLTSSSPPAKRDKLNLNFTPPNPFIPNLTTPTVNPNQFIYPPGFTPYDPRVMAAYHNLFYGQRGLPFTAPPLSSLGIELNQKRSFEMATPSSAKQSTLKLPPSPDHLKKIPGGSSSTTTTTTVVASPTHTTTTTTTTATTVTTTAAAAATITTSSSKSKPQTTAPPVNRKVKESTSKNEKSLKVTLEKLTQNRVKEIKAQTAKQAKEKIEQSEKEKKKDESTKDEDNHKEKSNGDVTPKKDEGESSGKVDEKPTESA